MIKASISHFLQSFLHCGEAESISDFFNCILNNDMLYKIAYCTNNRLPPGVPYTNENEIRAMIGLLLLFGVKKKSY